MSTTVRVTYEQFEEMGRRGDLDGTDDRYELLFGEVCLMTQPDPPHESIVDHLTEWSFEVLPPRAAWVRVQNTFGIPVLDSLTLPDLAWMRREDYSKRRPLPADVLLVVEVSASTLSRDRNTKGKVYARAGVADYWIVNVRKRCVEVRRDPEGDEYRTVMTLRPGEEARPLAFPGAALPVSRLFPDAPGEDAR